MRKGQGRKIWNQISAIITGVRTQHVGPAVRWKTMEKGSLEVGTAPKRLQEKSMEDIPQQPVRPGLHLKGGVLRQVSVETRYPDVWPRSRVPGSLLVAGNRDQRPHRGTGGWKDGSARVHKVLGSEQTGGGSNLDKGCRQSQGWNKRQRRPDSSDSSAHHMDTLGHTCT